MGRRRRAGGSIVSQRESEVEPPHVHVFRDGKMIAKFDLVRGIFIKEPSGRHRGRVLRALAMLGLIDAR